MGRPPGATSESTRSDILDAALEAFARSGFEAMSVRELTRRLQVSHNLVHHHFGSKENLWRAALDHGIGPSAEGLLELLHENVGSPDPLQVLRDSMERAIALLTQRPALVKVLSDESAREGPRLDYLYERYLGPMVEMLSRFLAQSTIHGLRGVDSRVAALFVLSSSSALFTHSALAEKLGVGTAKEGAYAEALVDLVLGGLSKPSVS